MAKIEQATLTIDRVDGKQPLWAVGVTYPIVLEPWELATWWSECVTLRSARDGTVVLQWDSKPWTCSAESGSTVTINRSVPMQYVLARELDVNRPEHQLIQTEIRTRAGHFVVLEETIISREDHLVAEVELTACHPAGTRMVSNVVRGHYEPTGPGP